MSLSVGSNIPNVTMHVLGDNGMPSPVNSVDALGTGKVVLFAVPGAFTWLLDGSLARLRQQPGRTSRQGC